MTDSTETLTMTMSGADRRILDEAAKLFNQLGNVDCSIEAYSENGALTVEMSYHHGEYDDYIARGGKFAVFPLADQFRALFGNRFVKIGKVYQPLEPLHQTIDAIIVGPQKCITYDMDPSDKHDVEIIRAGCKRKQGRWGETTYKYEGSYLFFYNEKFEDARASVIQGNKSIATYFRGTACPQGELASTFWKHPVPRDTWWLQFMDSKTRLMLKKFQFCSERTFSSMRPIVPGNAVIKSIMPRGVNVTDPTCKSGTFDIFKFALANPKTRLDYDWKNSGAYDDLCDDSHVIISKGKASEYRKVLVRI
ncbi:MAG: hypothetical protein JRN21_09755 [Nitrososphaerota archaeon]|nr:hypothetical protein [Nitrososphaerota archaeon]